MADSLLDQPRVVKMGVGEAIKRLLTVEFRYRQGTAALPEAMIQERDMIISALNQFELNLGFDCNSDGVPDTVEIFEQSAMTSCCRLLPTGKIPSETSRKPPVKKKTPVKAEPVVAVLPEPTPPPPEESKPVGKKSERGLRNLFGRKKKGT